MRWRCWLSSKSAIRSRPTTAAKALAEKSVQTGSRAGEIVLARVLVNQQAGTPNYPHAISLLQHAARDPESDSAVDAQMLLGLIYASGVHPRKMT